MRVIFLSTLASFGSRTVEALPISIPYWTQLSLLVYSYNLEIYFSLVTLAIPLGTSPGRCRLQLPTPEAHKGTCGGLRRACPWSELLLGAELASWWRRRQGRRVGEQRVSQAKNRRWGQASSLATSLPAREKRETNGEQTGSIRNWNQALRVYLGCCHWLCYDLPLPVLPIFPVCQCTSSRAFLIGRSRWDDLILYPQNAASVLGKDSL